MQIKSVLLLAVVALSCVLALVSAGPKHHTQRPKRSYNYYGDDDGYDMARMRYNYGDDVDSLPMARHRHGHGHGDDTDMAAQHYGYNRYGYGDDEDMKKQAAEMDRQHKKGG
ncbi:hypothetical protein RvY_14086 [Ramazzottius varieornatus]|uniref:Uncharacterized protein n=1 Tax=Ramazzottius varieornatus TaxID=947166 RepID=A0A1D1VQ48_RAMVA|nr:hypothetical protein RvY_14086 [Ramazzottius varieornatus]